MAHARNRGLILLFLLLSVVALAGLGQALYIERIVGVGGIDRSALAAVDRDFERATIAVADYRAAEAGYLAAGQQSSYWMTHADGLASTIRDVIDRRSADTESGDVKAAYESAGAALDDLSKLDSRARAFVQNEQRIIASDAIFMDSLQASNRVTQALANARSADHAAREAKMNLFGEVRLAGLGVSTIFVLIGSWVLLSGTRATTLETTMADATPAPTSSATSLSLGPIKLSTPSTPAAPPPPPVTAPAVSAPMAADRVPTVNLSEAADLCVDLARLLDGRDMPALFERAAHVLAAKGMVLWVTDADGHSLRPSLTHGYSEKVLAKMGALPSDGENATALAFRSLRPQIVGATSAKGAGALAVPLVTATGCVGVLSAETRESKPSQDMLSVAQMIAAQLAALVAPGEPAAQAQAH